MQKQRAGLDNACLELRLSTLQTPDFRACRIFNQIDQASGKNKSVDETILFPPTLSSLTGR